MNFLANDKHIYDKTHGSKMCSAFVSDRVFAVYILPRQCFQKLPTLWNTTWLTRHISIIVVIKWNNMFSRPYSAVNAMCKPVVCFPSDLFVGHMWSLVIYHIHFSISSKPNCPGSIFTKCFLLVHRLHSTNSKYFEWYSQESLVCFYTLLLNMSSTTTFYNLLFKFFSDTLICCFLLY